MQKALINHVPKNKFLEETKLTVFADINFVTRTIFLFDRAENTVEKGENAGYQHFLLFPQCFPKAFLPGIIECQDCVVMS